MPNTQRGEIPVATACSSPEKDQNLNSDNDPNNKHRSDDEFGSSKENRVQKKKRKRSRKQSNFDKIVGILVDSNNKREQEKNDSQLMRQKGHEERISRSQ